MRRYSQPHRRSFMLTLLSFATSAGFQGVSANPAQSGAKNPATSSLPVIRWGRFRNYQPVFVGISKGYFEEAGVRIELTGNFQSGPAIVQATGTGQVDAGHSAITGLANAAAAGVKVVGVADSQTEFTDAPLQQWFVLQGSPIRTIADLKGKKIGTNSLSGSFYYTALLAMRKHGLKREDVQFVVLPHDRQEQALRARQIDVAGIIDPYTVAIAAAGNVRRLFTGAEILGERQFSLVFFAKKFVDEQPETVRKFLAGYRKSIAFLAKEREQGNALMATALGLETSLVVPHRYTPDAKVILHDSEFWLNTMREGGELAQAPSLAVTDFVTDKFNL